MSKKICLLACAWLLMSCNPNTPGTPALDSVPEIATIRTEQQTVNAFYDALSHGKGDLAVKLLSPDKQEKGSFTAAGMTRYYSQLEQMVTVDRIDQAGESLWRVAYSYKEQGKERCKDIVDVHTTKQDGQWLIAKIIPQSICQSNSEDYKESTDMATIKAETQNSDIDNQFKCSAYGKDNYQNMMLADGSIKFEFFYSPILDTCLLEREEIGPEADDFVLKLYEMFSKNLILHYSNSGTGFCEQTKELGAAPDVECAASLGEYKELKQLLL